MDVNNHMTIYQIDTKLQQKEKAILDDMKNKNRGNILYLDTITAKNKDIIRNGINVVDNQKKQKTESIAITIWILKTINKITTN